jgi:hypothetical protein
MKILFASLLLILILAFQVCFGQELKEGEYWESVYGGKFDIWEYQYFSKDDVIKANKLFNTLKTITPQNEWEGQYYSETSLGESVMLWNENLGFVKYYFYHTLKVLYYGELQNKEDSIILSHETSPKFLNKKAKWSEIFVKVKLGEKHFLVPQTIIKGFCEFVAGRMPIHKQHQENIAYRFWEKIADSEKESVTLPTLPEKYKHFLVHPIKGKIKELGKRKIQRSKNWEGKIETDGVKYFVTLNVGKKDGVKKDIEFYIPKLKEFATVEKVFQKTVIATIFRRFDENNKEICEDMDHETNPCVQISVGLLAKTQNRFSYF